MIYYYDSNKENCLLWNKDVFLFSDHLGRRQDKSIGEIIDVFSQYFHSPYNEELGRDYIYDEIYSHFTNKRNHKSQNTATSSLKSIILNCTGLESQKSAIQIQEALKKKNFEISIENIKIHLFPEYIESALRSTKEWKETPFLTREYGFFQQIYPHIPACQKNPVFANILIATFEPDYFSLVDYVQYEAVETDCFEEYRNIQPFKASLKRLNVHECLGELDTFSFTSSKRYINPTVGSAKADITITPNNYYLYEFNRSELSDSLSSIEYTAPLIDSEFLLIVKILFSLYNSRELYCFDTVDCIGLAKLVEENTSDHNSVFQISEVKCSDFTTLICHSLRANSYHSAPSNIKICKHCRTIFKSKGEYLDVCPNCRTAKKRLKDKISDFYCNNINKYIQNQKWKNDLDPVEFSKFIIRAWHSFLMESIMETTTLIDNNMTSIDKKNLIQQRFDFLYSIYGRQTSPKSNSNICNLCDAIYVSEIDSFQTGKAYSNSMSKRKMNATSISKLKYEVLSIQNYVCLDIDDPHPMLFFEELTISEICKRIKDLRKISPCSRNIGQPANEEIINQFEEKFQSLLFREAAAQERHAMIENHKVKRFIT